MTSALAPPPRASAHLRSDKYLRFLVQKVSGCCAERFDQFLRDGSDRVGDVGQWAGSGFRTQWVVCSGFPLLLRELILRTFLRKCVINNTEKMYFRSSSRWKTVLMINVPVFFLNEVLLSLVVNHELFFDELFCWKTQFIFPFPCSSSPHWRYCRCGWTVQRLAVCCLCSVSFMHH